MMDQEYSFHISAKDGKRSVIIGGIDFTDELEGVEVHMHDGRPNALMLYAKPRSFSMEGMGFIYVQTVVNQQVLDDLNAKSLEDEALARMEWGEGSLAEKMLEVIKERLNAPA